MSKVRTRHHWFLVALGRIVFRSYFTLFHGYKATNAKNIPPEGPVLLTPNHQSFYDPPLVAMPTSRLVSFMALKKYCDNKIYGWAICNMGAFPIEGANDRLAYRDMLSTLNSGKCLTVYPEGSRSSDGALGKLQAGPARMALSTGATIVPVSIVGAYDAWPRAKAFPSFFKKIVVKYHKPILCEKVTDKGELKRRIQEVNQQLERVLLRRLRAWQRLQARKKHR